MYPRTYAQYTLLERLATGGMSEVDLARRSIEDTDYVRFLVIKRIRANHVEDEAFVRMFKDEARITSELRHTHIAQVYDFGRVEDEYFLALEYVPGTDVRQVLRRLSNKRKRMPVRMALRIAADVLSALHYAHTRTDPLGQPMRIVHRDVNPRNVMLSITGEVKLIDFGVARATDRLERTETDHFKGKIAYMAPEQVQGRDLDHRADVFAMGLMMYEMVMGVGAFAGLDQTRILYRLLQGELPQVKVPPEWGAAGRELRDVVNRALAHDPDARFDTAGSMAKAVERVAEAFGGMPDELELSTWLSTVEPDLEARVRKKMKAWSGVLPEALPTETQPAVIDQAESEPATSATLSRGMIVAAGAGTAGLGMIAVIGIVLVVAVSIGWWWLNLPPAPATPPLQVATADSDTDDEGPSGPLTLGHQNRDPDEAEPDVATSSRGGGSRASGQADPVVDAADTDSATDPSTDSGSPDDDTADTPDEGVQTAAVDTAPDSLAVPDAPPEPVAATYGRLQVTAANKGVEILIDGKPSGHRTGDDFRWPVGTYTVSADGYSPRTVQVRENMVKFVPLKP